MHLRFLFNAARRNRKALAKRMLPCVSVATPCQSIVVSGWPEWRGLRFRLRQLPAHHGDLGVVSLRRPRPPCAERRDGRRQDGDSGSDA